jgi:protein-S-isoprenylcysteine O-methyltransferase Ste14
LCLRGFVRAVLTARLRSVYAIRCIWGSLHLRSASPSGSAAWPAPIAVFVTTNFVHVPYEEAQMRREFGAVCDNYVVHVRRGL